MATAKEAQARIKINKLLESAGWRFFDDTKGKANIALEPNVKLRLDQVNDLGENFETTKNGFVDFLLLDDKSFPLVILEAKSEDKNPLVGKEQARKYAKSLNCRFVILSNGNLHYFWDLQQGNPHVITVFPTPDSLKSYQKFEPDQKRLITEIIGRDYIVQTQLPGYDKEAGWLNTNERPAFIAKNKLRFLRDYQKKALKAIQDAVAEDSTRFLFEMATGTGKTLTAAAVIKLFLRTGNACRVLFLVDRLELEDQAAKAFKAYLKNDYATAIYKERRDDWRKAEIVVTTVQSLLFNNKYKRLFSPTDFDLVISDEAHRSIGGNARAVFEYFVGYKLGLTATPRDYLKSFDTSKPTTRDPREQERRLLLDTYRTFGCETGQPTFSYSLLDGVKDGFLINPVVVDARTDITTRLLSEQGYAVLMPVGEDGQQEQSFVSKDFEKKFFSPATNELFCQTFIKNGFLDPVTGEFGKGLVFAVSQFHAANLTQILNEQADKRWPGKYQSDFAVQVTSTVPDAQQYTINFTNNNLLGSANFNELYKTSKARVCVTVGMMTTGYDCPDILNLALMRPVYSPSDFVQIKGRGTRRHNFLEQLFDDELKPLINKPEKARFKFFDFFANCEYFEEKFDYDEVLKLPTRSSEGDGCELPPTSNSGLYEHTGSDAIYHLSEQHIGYEGMKIDRMFFEKFEEQVKAVPTLRQQVENGQWEQAINYVTSHLFDKPNEYFNLDKLRHAAGVDRRLSLKEILQKIFGLLPYFKSKDELLEDEFQEFLLANQSKLAEDQGAAVLAMKYFFKAYATNADLRAIVDDKRFGELNVNPAFGVGDLQAVPPEWREDIPEYVKDYVPLNQFM
ncbi:TPA: DEAD/DEAH box helicase family protein [Aeromonas hydrophila]|nr:DEAD/DEAH box helicase family protein [Aeromonas hydrophila]UBQ52087.1 DEAD/DEAH box helicase family protein [Aeromonas hydrophila]HDI1215369.1 DEAD/DEAH box helicase family protein [Aeromonas hydrophila]HEB5078072.1 DEAD/DEAH box helicase family protein [Aeromonas hydrophila subsp. hydrophila]